MTHNISIKNYSPPDEYRASEFIIDGALHAVKTAEVDGLRVRVTHAQSLTDGATNNHGTFYKRTDVQLSASSLKRIERILYVCAAKLAFCTLYSQLRNGASANTAAVPRHITDRAIRMNFNHLDVATANSVAIRIYTAIAIERFRVKDEALAIFGEDLLYVKINPASVNTKEVRFELTDVLVKRLEEESGLLEKVMQLRNFPERNCIISKMKALEPAIQAKRQACNTLKDILGT